MKFSGASKVGEPALCQGATKRVFPNQMNRKAGIIKRIHLSGNYGVRFLIVQEGEIAFKMGIGGKSEKIDCSHLVAAAGHLAQRWVRRAPLYDQSNPRARHRPAVCLGTDCGNTLFVAAWHPAKRSTRISIYAFLFFMEFCFTAMSVFGCLKFEYGGARLIFQRMRIICKQSSLLDDGGCIPRF